MIATNGNNQSVVTPCLGHEVAREVLQWIGALRLLVQATIISYNMQDYEFWGNGRLSQHLLKQLALGASITVMTTPPPGQRGDRRQFQTKLKLLEELDRNGATVYLHPDLHAKAYLFRDDSNSEMAIVGSPNLTSAGFGNQPPSVRTLLELALLTEDPTVYTDTRNIIETKLIGNHGTLDFATWVVQNRSIIAQAKGAR